MKKIKKHSSLKLNIIFHSNHLSYLDNQKYNQITSQPALHSNQHERSTSEASNVSRWLRHYLLRHNYEQWRHNYDNGRLLTPRKLINFSFNVFSSISAKSSFFWLLIFFVFFFEHTCSTFRLMLRKMYGFLEFCLKKVSLSVICFVSVCWK